MDPGVMATRRALAINSLVENSEIIARELKLDNSVLAVKSPDPQVKYLLQLEAVAAFVEEVGSKLSSTQTLPTMTDRLSSLTVEQTKPIIEAATLEELDELEEAEDAGKQRAGVFSAIDQRRQAFEAGNKDAGSK